MSAEFSEKEMQERVLQIFRIANEVLAACVQRRADIEQAHKRVMSLMINANAAVLARLGFDINVRSQHGFIESAVKDMTPVLISQAKKQVDLFQANLGHLDTPQ